MGQKTAIIIGAGPAGLGAGVELVKKGIKPLILERENQVGGISKTINYKGYYFDLGGHRFFTKSNEIMTLWEETLNESEFLERPRLSRIYYNNKFFFYPLQPANALFNLGLITSTRVLLSYFKSKISPYKDESTFDGWVSNRFGKKLFNIFFKTYTEKLWGIPCEQIEAKWVAQRIKGLSLASAIKNAFLKDKGDKIKTLITKFHYPKYGPGMMYKRMAKNIKDAKGELFLNQPVKKIYHNENKIIRVEIQSTQSNRNVFQHDGEFFISTLPITSLIKKLDPPPALEVLKAAQNLKFRSFLVVNVILKVKNLFPDNWIYIHSPEVKLGRIQNYKNWSEYMIKDENYTGLGLEYFCSQGDEFWNKKDSDLIKLALKELERINIAKASQFVDGFVARVPDTYPVYSRGYGKHLDIIKNYLSNFKNFQTVGRGGMFRYNNMDHSILSGIYGARNILGENYNVWDVNIEEEYHEEIKQK